MATRARFAVDRTVTLDINGSSQPIRLCAARDRLPPLLVVQGGPGLPLLHEVPKFQRLLDFERAFLVGYWEQRGCGNVSRREAASVSIRTQIEDLQAAIRWLSAETGQRVTVLGVSWGATVTLQAVAREPDHVKAVIAISPDSRTTTADAAADRFLRDRAQNGNGRLRRQVEKLAPPPYLEPAAFQRRTRLMANLGTIEYGKSFNALVAETLALMIRAYGAAGALKALANINTFLRTLLPEVASLDLFASPPRVPVPVHYVFGELDVLNPVSLVQDLPAAIAAPVSTIVRVPDAGHMVHFNAPAVLRSIAENA
jgi:pimeloyl-ACP methyl ester carboxylesterase